jgi:hypothetical protein
LIIVPGSCAGRAEFRELYSRSYRPWHYSLEGFLIPFFIRPKPVIKDLTLQSPANNNTREIVNIEGAQVSLWGSRSTELWINITNEGKTPIKRMRARSKLHLIPKTTHQIQPQQRPEGMTEEQWNQLSNLHQEFMQNVERQMSDSMFGRPLPFSRTPRGTVGFPWVQADGRLTYETDLTPNSDEASIRLIGIWHLSDVGRSDLANSGRVNVPQGARIVGTQIGSVTGVAINPSTSDTGSLAYDLAVKFWIVAENLSEEVSKIFQIEIPESYQGISCTEVKEKSEQYKEFSKLLAV